MLFSFIFLKGVIDFMERYEANQRIRLLLGITGSELAKRVGVTKQTISNYERGHPVRKPTQRIIELELDDIVKELKNDSVKKVCLLLQSYRLPN